MRFLALHYYYYYLLPYHHYPPYLLSKGQPIGLIKLTCALDGYLLYYWWGHNPQTTTGDITEADMKA